MKMPASIMLTGVVRSGLMGVWFFDIGSSQQVIRGYVEKFGEKFQMVERQFVFFTFIIGIILS